jgi:acyl-CoA thioesterase FadM
LLLLFRFLRVVLAGLLGPRRGVLDESILHFRVWPTDIDLNFHLNDGRYVSLMGLGRAHLLARTGLLRRAFKRKWAPVVGAAIIRYRREIRTFEKFALRSRIIGWDEKWLYIEHALEAGGNTRATALVRGVLRDRNGAVPTAEVMKLMGWAAGSPDLPEAVRQWPDIGAPASSPATARRCAE